MVLLKFAWGRLSNRSSFVDHIQILWHDGCEWKGGASSLAFATLLMVPSTNPTPAARPPGRTFLSIGGPCLSAASWFALLFVTSAQSDAAGGASLVLGPFAEKKGPRLPGRNPATALIA